MDMCPQRGRADRPARPLAGSWAGSPQALEREHLSGVNSLPPARRQDPLPRGGAGKKQLGASEAGAVTLQLEAWSGPRGVLQHAPLWEGAHACTPSSGRETGKLHIGVGIPAFLGMQASFVKSPQVTLTSKLQEPRTPAGPSPPFTMPTQALQGGGGRAAWLACRTLADLASCQLYAHPDAPALG